MFEQGSRAVDPEGITAQEILQFIRVHGPRTVPRLARELNLEVKTVTGYVRALERRKVVETHLTGRGALVAHLAGTTTRRRRARRRSASNRSDVPDAHAVASDAPQPILAVVVDERVVPPLVGDCH